MRVLALRALGLGDLLTAVPALRAIRRAHPGAHLTLSGPAALADLALLTGAVDEVHPAQPLAPLDDALRGVELAINLHGRGPQSTDLLRRLDPERLVAFGVGSTWRADEHEVVRWCRLVAEAGMPADPTDLLLLRPALPPLVDQAIVVHPGAAIASRHWPAQRWAEVAGRLHDLGGQPVVITGGPGERQLAGEVAAGAGLPASAVLAGRTSPLELAALVADAALVVCPDTGIGHLATAYGTPSVLLFGPTPPALWGPPAARPQHRVLWAGRTGDPFAADPDPGLLELTVDEVVGAALAGLGETARRTVMR